VATFRSPLKPSELQRLGIMSRGQDNRFAEVCELIADLADSWGNPVAFALPTAKTVPADESKAP
jgi:hypothetical protein